MKVNVRFNRGEFEVPVFLDLPFKIFTRIRSEGLSRFYTFLFAFLSLALVLNTANANQEESAELTFEYQEEASVEDEADQIITNRLLRAEWGSLDAYSFSLNLGYSAGSLRNPLGIERPDLRGVPGQVALHRLGGSFGVRYRITPTVSSSLGVGVETTSPFHGPRFAEANLEGDNLDNYRDEARKLSFRNPSLSVTNISNVFGIQNVTSVGATVGTTVRSRNMGSLGSFSLSQSSVYNIPLVSGLSVGTAMLLSTAVYSSSTWRGGERAGQDARSNQYRYGFGIYPSVEYIIDDTFNLRTLVGFPFYNMRNMPVEQIKAENFYQSIGLGISVTRDIFLYPNIQFVWNDIRSDFTNIGFSATINL